VVVNAVAWGRHTHLSDDVELVSERTCPVVFSIGNSRKLLPAPLLFSFSFCCPSSRLSPLKRGFLNNVKLASMLTMPWLLLFALLVISHQHEMSIYFRNFLSNPQLLQRDQLPSAISTTSPALLTLPKAPLLREIETTAFFVVSSLCLWCCTLFTP
jgi:hypothetical protein